MKGILQRTEFGWHVTYEVINSYRAHILHPQDVLYVESLQPSLVNTEVEFEIVKEYDDDIVKGIRRYAKLIIDEDDGLTDDEWLIKERYKEIGSTAVDFAKWISGKYTFGNILGKWYLHENTNKQYTEEELFELYKQTKS